MKTEDIKIIVREKYGKIAEQDTDTTGCCGSSCCGSDVDYSIFSENYEKKDGYNPDADLNLGCGIPTDFAGIRKGDNVLDLGSGAGNDCFVARALAGENGKVTGLDFTPEMLKKAKENNSKLGYENVEFVEGDIEEIPLSSDSFDVVISNCVLNLVPDKSKAFSEIYRVLKPGGHFCVSDVVIKGSLSEKLRKDAEMYAGCVSGASDIDEYLGYIKDSGFKGISLHKQKEIKLPEDTVRDFNIEKETGIFSITVTGYKQ
ncbi:MAG TPA: arsenite methyltransferase [Bacteroidales bacterium]|nr:arsenite methyltransferase [Bacteroidales bacterium]